MTDIESETTKLDVIEFLRIKCEILETENEGLKTNHEKYLNHLEIVIKENYKLRNERQKEISEYDGLIYDCEDLINTLKIKINKIKIDLKK